MSYWTNVLEHRVNRRRAIAATGGALSSAALLAACGGSGDSQSGTTARDKSSLVAPLEDETKKLKRGGIFRSVNPTPVSLDPHLTSAGVLHIWHSYSPIFKVKEGFLQPANGEIEGELADSWEFSPDKTTLTIKITRDMGFAPLPPVNGRAVDAQDVLFTWKRYLAMSPRRGELANEFDPTGPITSLTAPDDRTVVIKLKEPNATFLAQLAVTFAGTLLIVPREAENASVLDLRNSGGGTGPFYLSNMVQSATQTYKRNPNFKKDKRELPYVDGVEYADLPEYASQLAQFRAGNVYDTFFGYRGEDILPTKQDIPALDIQPSPQAAGTLLRQLFGFAADSPFKDERVRQAYSMTLDRDLFIDVAYNVSSFEKSGLPVVTAWETAVNVGTYAGWWLDPKSKDFGPNAKNLQHDPAEAKKLMAAAGFATGVDHDVYSTSPMQNQQQMDSLIGMTRDSGLFRPRSKILTTAEFATTFRNNRGKFSGTAFIIDNRDADPVVDAFAHYHSSGGRYFGGDEKMDGYLNQALREFDNQKRQALVHEMQRYEGGKLFQPKPGGASSFRMTWPVVRNKLVWQPGTNVRLWAAVWLDPERPPLKS